MNKNTLSDIQLIKIPKITDPRGNLAVIERDTVPFAIKRVYYLFDVPSGSFRGGHSHRHQKEFLVALSGSFNIVLQDGREKKPLTLKKPDEGLLIPTGIWRELDDFSSGAVCLVVSSGEFDEGDYIRDFDAFLASKGT